MKDPVANGSPQAVALRKAAAEFVRLAADGPKDDEDTAGQRRNRALLEAAVEYARVAEGRTRSRDRSVRSHQQKAISELMADVGAGLHCLEFEGVRQSAPKIMQRDGYTFCVKFGNAIIRLECFVEDSPDGQ